jgi:2-polyprenyl-6-methoxyphenol hydroxylase-like FAD-dependent oxidoreductase
MFLARQGFTVDVYERRPEPKQDAVDTGRAYIIILIPRGQAALKEVTSSRQPHNSSRAQQQQLHMLKLLLLLQQHPLSSCKYRT